MKTWACIWCLAGLLTIGCRSDNKDVSALRIPDSSAQKDGRPTSGSGKASHTPDKVITHSTTIDNGTGNPEVQRINEASTSPRQQVAPDKANSVPMGLVPGVGRKWWDFKSIFFIDYVGETGGYVYESVKGQHYFPETKIFVYTTDDLMEGTTNYDKVADIFNGTELDDRVFIWVHLDQKRKPIFVKKLISDNIKDKIDQGPLTIE